MEPSEYIKIAFTVPESHADELREAMGKADGKMGNYTFCSFSTKGIGRFKPGKGSRPFIGRENVLELVEEEKIETVCRSDELEQILEAIKKTHPYEETFIEITPIYQMGVKRPIVS